MALATGKGPAKKTGPSPHKENNTESVLPSENSVDTEGWLHHLLSVWDGVRDYITPQDMGEILRHGLPLTKPIDPYDAARRLYAAGASREFIMDRYRFTESDMDEALRQFNEEVRDMIALNAQGRTVKQISDALGIPRNLIYYHFRRHGITPHRTIAEPLTARQVKDVLRLYRAGTSMSAIARTIGGTRDQVRYIVRTMA